jgi:hypothetical protein
MTPHMKLDEKAVEAARAEAAALLVQPDFADSIVAAYLSASHAPQGGVRVKELVWERISSRIYDASAAGLGLYRIQSKDDCWMAYKYGDTFRADRGTLDEAKAAAQADYEARVRSALTWSDPQ